MGGTYVVKFWQLVCIARRCLLRISSFRHFFFLYFLNIRQQYVAFRIIVGVHFSSSSGLGFLLSFIAALMLK